jgi:hypothetical protein
MHGSAMMYVTRSLYRRQKLVDQFPSSLEERRFRHHLVEAGGMRTTETGGVRVVRVAENRHVWIGVRDVQGLDSRDVGDHEIRRLDPVGGLEAMLWNNRLELPADVEIDPEQQDRRHD